MIADNKVSGQLVRLEIRRVDHDRLVLGSLGGQADHDPGEDSIVAPALPAVVECLGRTLFLRRIVPAQPIAIYEDYAAQDATIIDAGLAMALRKERFETVHLRDRQPLKIAHRSGLLAEPEPRQRP